MKKRISYLFIISVLAVMFILAGVPLLRYLKEYDPSEIFEQNQNDSGTGSESIWREVTIDLSVEDICTNPVTGRVEPECSSPGDCKETCMGRGCILFGLNYKDFQFVDNKCYCNCYEENKIKKALGVR